MKKQQTKTKIQPKQQQTAQNGDKSTIFIVFGILLLFPLLLVSTNTLDRVIWIRLLASQVLLLILAAWCFWQQKRFSAQSIISPLNIALFCYFAYSIIPLLHTNNFPDGRIDWLKSSLLCLLTPILAILWQNNMQKNIAIATKSLLVFGLIALVGGLFQLFSLFSSGDVSHAKLYVVYSFFAHKNLFSEVLFQILCFSIIGIILLRKWWRNLAVAIAIVTLLLIVILMTRAVWVASIAALLVSLVALFFTKQALKNITKKLFQYAAIGIIIIVLGILVYAKFGSSDAFLTQASQITATDYGTPKDRIELWKKSADIINRAPVFGNGQGTWKINIMDRGSNNLLSSDNVTFYQQPHNDIIWLAAEQGYLGAILYLAIFAFAAFFALRIARKSESEQYRSVGIVLFAALTGFFVASLFSFPRERIEHTILLSIILSFIIALSPSKSSISVSAISQKRILQIFLLLVLCISSIGILWSAKRFAAEKQLKTMLDMRASQDLAALITCAESIDSTVCQLDPFTTPIAWYKGEAQFTLNRPNEAFQSFLSAWRRNPWHVHVLNNLGTCYETMQNHDSALACYGRAIAMSHHFNDALQNAAAIHFNFKRYDTAYSLIRQLDTNALTDRSRLFIKTIARGIIKQMAVNETDETLNETLKQIHDNDEKLLMFHFKSINNHNSLQAQILIDFISECESKNIIITSQALDNIKQRKQKMFPQ